MAVSAMTKCLSYPSPVPKGNARYMYDGTGGSDRSESNRGHDGETEGLLVVTDFAARVGFDSTGPPDL